jgi:hypothetical protein
VLWGIDPGYDPGLDAWQGHIGLGHTVPGRPRSLPAAADGAGGGRPGPGARVTVPGSPGPGPIQGRKNLKKLNFKLSLIRFHSDGGPPAEFRHET